MSGVAGSLRAPLAPMRTSAVCTPADVSRRHVLVPSSQQASSTAVFSLMWGRTSKRSAVRRRYAQISGCGEYVLLHSGFRAKEKE